MPTLSTKEDFRARRLGWVLDWAELRREELRDDNWNKGQEHKPLNPIQTLEL